MATFPAPELYNVIRRIVGLKKILKQWRNNAATDRIPSDVRAGHIAVYVGAGFKRFIVRAIYLNHPLFKKLLEQAEDEFGFAYQGPLVIPCDESAFEEVLRSVSSISSPKAANQEPFRKLCHNETDLFSDLRPLAHDKSIC